MTVTGFIGNPFRNSEMEELTARTGYKVIRLEWNKGNPRIIPPHWQNRITQIADQAKCSKTHSTPEEFEKCSCGFYAYITVAEAVSHSVKEFSSASNCFIADVALSGQFVEAEKGYKASRQRVRTLVIPGCWNCGEVSECLVMDVSGFMLGSCVACAEKEGASQVTFDEFSELISPKGYSPIRIVSSLLDPEAVNRVLGYPDEVQRIRDSVETLVAGGRLDLLMAFSEMLNETLTDLMLPAENELEND